MPTPPLSQDRLVRKEVALGIIREYEPPQKHIGLQYAPFKDVATDDVIFDYVRGLTAGLAPARAEDAESELAGHDDSTATGRASIIDWAHKNHYDPSDISRWREALLIRDIAGATSLPLTVNSILEGWDTKVARDGLRRMRMLQNRIEWLIMTGMFEGVVSYNDGKIKFSVDWGRPSGQDSVDPSTLASTADWDDTGADPIEDLRMLKSLAYDTYGVDLNRGIMSTANMRLIRQSSNFVVVGGPSGANKVYVDPNWTDEAALRYLEEAVGIKFEIYDAVYRTRPLGSNTVTNTRFSDSTKVLLLPAADDVAEYDDTVGFAATLTSPHPEGNWTPGFYEWEKDTGPDPWGHDFGTGIKCFPVFPHLDMSWTLKVTGN